MRKAVIDIGTNTVLLLIAEYDAVKEKIITLRDTQEIPRLGKGIASNRTITQKSIEKAVNILNHFKTIMYNYEVKEITVTATSFLRDSVNKDEFVSRIFDKTGIQIELLTGEEEAKWTFIGGTYDFLKEQSGMNISVIDIGGGSTEIMTGIIDAGIRQNSLPEIIQLYSKGKLDFNGISLNVGSVRIQEKFRLEQPPKTEDVAVAYEYILSEFEKYDYKPEKSKLVGIAGTATTLAALKLKLKRFDRKIIDGAVLTLNDIQELFGLILFQTKKQLLKNGSYMEGRADIIFSGLLILKTYMELFHYSEITVSTKGLRYGIFLREA